MQKRNLTKEKIIQVAFLLADEIGLNQVTFQKIGEKLDIKYPSLYNHFANMNDLKIKMTIYFLKDLNFKLIKGLVGKSGENAIRELAYVYRDFALENKSGYELFMSIPSSKNEEVNRLAKETYSIIRKILEFYIDDKTYLIHKSRELRSILHGFVSLSFLGYFQNKINSQDSFKLMLDDFILSISINKNITN
ncbi:TetR/AcrR family transcriptional regulator [Clostridium tyrobutyricum]|uniref:TetR family transcriptional regulator n=1 Tax=Clostridium tyrobutyricum TaxID=1519 RepID=A0A0A7HJJ1_CLOTY|nr:TetR-like C-terminal domain-containing protein [Clostridium tyrobutyricum]AIZ03785.1 TetR family transcriptional regulator [Clostridium tyrobutyricum]MBV4416985.1 WHG domain-containing protein [Clostridium tyrobutyricum]